MHNNPHIQDSFGRQFKTLRISLTDVCNMGCTYCTSGKKTLQVAREEHLPLEELLCIVSSLHKLLQFTTVRLTGGEPLLYKELIPLINALHGLSIPSIKMTTNAYTLPGKAQALKAAGLNSINISLDAVDPHTFTQITGRKHLHWVLEGIEQALEAGISVKLNCVVVKGTNEHQIIPLLHYAMPRKIPVRFLEVMKMGHLHHEYEKYLFPQTAILDTIAQVFPFRPMGRAQAATTRYWEMDNGYHFGIIANESDPFCQDCDRLRLDSYGNIFGCLSSNIPINIRAQIHRKEELKKNLITALHQKQSRFIGSELSMMAIGG